MPSGTDIGKKPETTKHPLSEEVQEIISRSPRWVVKWGISALFCLIIILFIGTWYVRYPEIMTTSIVVTTENPPVYIVAQNNGRIAGLFVKDKQFVVRGAPLAVIENPVDYEDVIDLKSKLSLVRMLLESEKHPAVVFKSFYKLGEIQKSYSSFEKSYQDYLEFIRMNYYEKKIPLLNKQLNQQKSLSDNLTLKIELLQKENDMFRNKFEKDSISFTRNVLSIEELENLKKVLLQQEYALSSAWNDKTTSEIEVSHLEQTVMELEQQYVTGKKQTMFLLRQNYDNLLADIAIWEQNYVLLSPIDGKVALTDYWSANQKCENRQQRHRSNTYTTLEYHR